MPRPRFLKLDADKQERILNAALEEFATHGFRKASYNQIIDKAGVSKGAMYYYFDDKADLYATVFRKVQRQIDSALHLLDHVATPQEYWRELERISERLLSFSVANPLIIGLIRSAWKLRLEGETEVISELMDFTRSWTANLLRLGQGAGAVRSDLPFDYLVSLVQALDDAADHWMMERLDMDYEALLAHGRQSVGMLWRLLSPDLPATWPGSQQRDLGS